jgi:CubicO group peptidase (beta-lactamase class C family)
MKPTRRDFLRSTALMTLIGPLAHAQTSAPGLNVVDHHFRDFLQSEGVTAAQLAIFRRGTLQLSRTYAAPPPAGFSPVTSKTLFRLASCSKLFVCAGIEALRLRGRLHLHDHVFPLLGIDAPAIARDHPSPYINDITIQHLIDHAGGWNDHNSVRAKDGTHIPGTAEDPTFRMREIALELHLSTPPSKLDIARYMYGKPLQFVPGSQDFDTTSGSSYSNFGYLLLGMVIEKVSGKSFPDFVRTELQPASDASNVYLSRMMSPQDLREVWYEDPGHGPTSLNPRASTILPAVSGGGGFITDIGDSDGGLMTNAETLAHFISQNAVWGMGGRAAGYARSGSLPGTSSYATSLENGVDCAYILNTRAFKSEGAINHLETSLEKLLAEL